MYYRPEPNFITADVAEALAQDFDVTVVTAHPNYPRGRFYDGVRSPWRPQRAVEGRVTVWRVPLVPYHGNSVGRRALMYLTFAASAAVVAPVVAGRPEVVWVYQTPFTSALAALWFRWVGRARLVFTYADLWPEAMLATRVARPGLLVRALFAYSRWINRAADRIIASTRGTARRYEQDGYAADRLEHVPVWVDGVDAAAGDDRADSGERRAIVYAGNLGPGQRVDTLVRAAALLRRDGVEVTVDVYGNGSEEERLRTLAEELMATNVHFHGRVAPAEAFAVSRRALAQVVSLEPSPLFAMTVPSKLAFCFAAGAPILAGLPGESAELAQESGGAIAFDPRDPGSLAAAIRQLLDRSPAERAAMGTRLRDYHAAGYAKPRLLDRYRAILGAHS
jgi:glycosyltransferase involved in cell wall biosynthesis